MLQNHPRSQQISSYFMLFITAVLLAILSNLAEAQNTQRAGAPVKPNSTMPKTVQPLFQKKPLSNFSNSLPAPRNTGNSTSQITTVNSYYPDWNAWKAMYKKSYSPQQQPVVKKNYVMNCMFLIETSFLNFSFNLGVNEATANDWNKLNFQNNAITYTPEFEQDFLSTFNKTYKSADEQAYRQRVYYQNIKSLPGNFYWSDWTIDQFNSLVLPANLISKMQGNRAVERMLQKYTVLQLRHQKAQGSKFNTNPTVMNINIENPAFSPTKLLLSRRAAVRPRQVMVSGTRNVSKNPYPNQPLRRPPPNGAPKKQGLNVQPFIKLPTNSYPKSINPQTMSKTNAYINGKLVPISPNRNTPNSPPLVRPAPRNSPRITRRN